MSPLYIIFIVLLVLLLFGGLPNTSWGGWHHYGYWPSGLGGLLLVILLILVLTGRL